ncbi:Aph phosphorylate [Mycena indigotica]|uniref:Aph phosphorylate n=1 Tax=Mycena indigotica TaxID=2126181 RepID=A0A8H6SB72_9AGAR|nr:Aph phosphorylate [Mycena indigotica]KAF7294655.1 Aph phosphorylate [Mycena indigotica]
MTLAKVLRVLKLTLRVDVPATRIRPIGRGYNNDLFIVDHDEFKVVHHKPQQAGTVPPASGAKTVVVRLLKTALDGLLERTENEVAALSLVRGPLHKVVHVPKIYAWSTTADEFPFIIMEHLEGVPLDTIWPTLDLPARLLIVQQIATILKTLQSIPSPTSVDTFGGLSFTPSGDITTSMHPDGLGGPFSSAHAQWLSMLTLRLRDAEANSVIEGWKANGLRDRIEAFVASHKFSAIINQAATEPVFVHGDFNCRNMLVSPDTHKITGLLDFEFARIDTAPEELMDGLEDFRGHTCLQPPPKGLQLHLLDAKSSWPCQRDDYSLALSDGCQIALAWKDAFRIDGPEYDATARAYSFLENLCP